MFPEVEGEGGFRLRFILWSTFQDVRVIAVAVRNACEPLMGDARAAEIEIGLVEVFNNIILHGYSQARGRIRVSMMEGREEVVLVVDDYGVRPAGFEFEAPPPRDITSLDLLDLPESGFGISLVHQCFDRLLYTSVDRMNRLTLVKAIRPGMDA